MSTVTVRELQKNLKRTLLRVERGETLQITRRRRTVARLTPEIVPTTPTSKPEPWPDLADGRQHWVHTSRICWAVINNWFIE